MLPARCGSSAARSTSSSLDRDLPVCSHPHLGRILALDETIDWTLGKHPQAQLRRSRWTDLRGTWGLAFDDEDRGVEQDWPVRSEMFDREILVPFPPESPAS